jgi:uncharacterized protein (TIGR04255 family)
MVRRKYRNPPIEEAVCDIQFAPGTEWDPTMSGRLYEKLKDVYNEKPRPQHVVEPPVMGIVRSEGKPSASLARGLFKERVQLLAKNGTRIVGISADQLSVHMLRPYTDWEEFRPSIMQALTAYRGIAGPEAVARIGLRYINFIAIGPDDQDLSRYFTIPPKFPDVDPPTRVLGFFNRKEAEFIDKPIRIVITFTNLEPKQPDILPFLLDIDVIWIRPDDPFSLDEVETVLEDMKVRHRQVFESLITDEARRLFDVE